MLYKLYYIIEKKYLLNKFCGVVGILLYIILLNIVQYGDTSIIHSECF